MTIEYECPGCGVGIPGELAANALRVTAEVPGGFRLHLAHGECATRLPSPPFRWETEDATRARLAAAMGDIHEEPRP